MDSMLAEEEYIHINMAWLLFRGSLTSRSAWSASITKGNSKRATVIRSVNRDY